MDEGKTACFNIYAQFFVDQTATPIENPSIDWTEQNATPRRVAQLIIPPQPSNQIVANQKTCEHFSFSPWRTIKDHEPLGGINRLRKVIYKELSQQRHHLNREPNKEPGLETFPKL